MNNILIMNNYKVFFFYFLFRSLNGFYTNNNNSPHFHLCMKKSQCKLPKINLYTPKSENQKRLVNFLDDDSNKIVISLGPAGTGKTLFSCQKAITELKKEEIQKIIITRPVVTVEEEIGFLPGNIVKKMDPWTKPIFDIFLDYYTKTELDLMLNSGKIEICPLAFMRGRTFKNAFILADEMQNSSPNQMKMLTTRIGMNTRLVITGDLNQTDILRENGLYDFVRKIERYNDTELIKIIKFSNDDVERSEIVKKVLSIYNYVKPMSQVKNIDEIIVSPPPLTICNTSSLINTTTPEITSVSKQSKKQQNKYGDAALIPKHHISHNFDIFFESRDF